ncbi:EthD family reductase [Mycobacterium sp. DL99]|uniref:EthD family reductase n=1 Tax=Mycobacterium sp. DL99 TaxID=2528957 RepID=UPI001080A687|nr:EthD family reductase [Mycobacterium sp. DL99]
MYRAAIVYNRPEDPARFDSYYRDQHLPKIRKIPGLHRLAAGKCDPLDDGPPAAYALAMLYFETQAQCLAALSSPEGQAAATDAQQFATGGMTLITSDEEIVWP